MATPFLASKKSNVSTRGAIRLVALVFLAISGFTSHSSISAAPLTLALSLSPLSLPFFVAESEGFYAAEGVQVRTNEVIGGYRAMQDMLAGKADLATCSEAVIMFTSFKRDDFVVLASFGTSLEDVKIVTLDSSKVARPRDLAHRRVATISGSASHYYLDTLALLDGVAPESLEIVAMPPEAMAGALQQGAVDAIAVWQPFAYQAQHNLPGELRSRFVPVDGGPAQRRHRAIDASARPRPTFHSGESRPGQANPSGAPWYRPGLCGLDMAAISLSAQP